MSGYNHSEWVGMLRFRHFFNTLTLILAEADGSKHNMMFEQNVRSLHIPVIAVHSAPC